MFESPLQPKRMAIGATVIIAVTISCLGIVRTQRFAAPDAGVKYTCSSGTACVEGTSTGTPYGVYGDSSGGNGVEGKSSAAAKAGVSGLQLGTSGIGVYGESQDTTGKYAGVVARGDESATNIFYGYNSATHASCLIDPSSNLTCKGAITGISSNLNGVYGTSSTLNGVYGAASVTYASGVYGTTTNARGYGVFGDSSSSGSGRGVVGQDEGAGAGVYAISVGGIALYASAGTSSAMIFDGTSGNGSYCQIDFSANLVCTGQITGGHSLETRHRTSTGHHVLTYSSESTTASIEDVGTARISGGVGNVQLEPRFASTIDRNGAYYVFLTPLGDTHGLYVSMKTPTGFQVRESQGGRSTVGFDYRIVAHPADAGNARLPSAPAVKLPNLPHPTAAQQVRQP
jgi:hypothetical protein